MLVTFGCSAKKHDVHYLDELNLDTLMSPNLSEASLLKYLRGCSLHDSEFVELAGSHCVVATPVYLRGLPGSLWVSWFDFQIRQFGWYPEQAFYPRQDASFRGQRIIFAGDSVKQKGWPDEEHAHWSQAMIYDTLNTRMATILPTLSNKKSSDIVRIVEAPHLLDTVILILYFGGPEANVQSVEIKN